MLGVYPGCSIRASAASGLLGQIAASDVAGQLQLLLLPEKMLRPPPLRASAAAVSMKEPKEISCGGASRQVMPFPLSQVSHTQWQFG